MWQLNLFDYPLPTPPTTPPKAAPSSSETPTGSTTKTEIDPFAVKYNADGSRRIENFGEVLPNSRRAPKKEEVDENILDLRIASMPLDKVWPKTSLYAMKDKHMAACLFLRRSRLPDRRPTGRKLLDYVMKVSSYMTLQEKVEAGTVDATFLIDCPDELESRLKYLEGPAHILSHIDTAFWDELTAHSPRVRLNSAVEILSGKPIYETNQDGEKVEIPFTEGYKRAVLRGNFAPEDVNKGKNEHIIEAPTIEALGAEISAFLRQALPKMEQRNEKPVSILYSHNHLQKTYTILGRRGNVTLPIEVLTDVNGIKDVVDYVNAHEKELAAKFNTLRDQMGKDIEDSKKQLIRDRIGTDWRHGKDVTPEQFMETFGFRGIEFGNWVKQGKNSRERQWMLNNAYDAFNDLAELLNVPPKAMALDGTLGLAFGARGRGKALAHYERDTQIINLTKTKGYSSLAHEWFHALDNYIARSNTKDMRAFQSNFSNRLIVLSDQAKERITAELVAKHPNVSSNQVEHWVTHIERRVSNLTEELPPDSERKFFYGNNLISGSVLVKAEDTQFTYPDLLKTTLRPELFHAWRDTIETIRTTRMSERTRERASILGGNIEQEYWYCKIEQAARCFEAFVETKLQKQGKISDYLTVDSYSEKTIKSASLLERSKSADNAFYPYLDGDDVERVSQKFQHIFDVIQTRSTEKGVMLFSMIIDPATKGMGTQQARDALSRQLGANTIDLLEKNGLLTLAKDENEARVLSMLQRAQMAGEIKLALRSKDGNFYQEVLQPSYQQSLEGINPQLPLSKRAQGFYDSIGKRTHLIAGHVNEENAYPVLLHEVGIHMAHDSCLKPKLEPVIDRACAIVAEGSHKGDPIAQAVCERMVIAGLTPKDIEYNEEICAYLVEEAAKVRQNQPPLVKAMTNMKSSVKTWLFDKRLLSRSDLDAFDIVKMAEKQVKALAKMTRDEAFNLTPDQHAQKNTQSCKSEPFDLANYFTQKVALGKTLEGEFMLSAYEDYAVNRLRNTLDESTALQLAREWQQDKKRLEQLTENAVPIELPKDETKTTEDDLSIVHFEGTTLGDNITINEAIKRAEALYGRKELDNIVFVPKGSSTAIPISETLAIEVAEQLEADRLKEAQRERTRERHAARQPEVEHPRRSGRSR